MIHIVTDNSESSGLDTWNNMFIYNLQKHKIPYTLYTVEKFIKESLTIKYDPIIMNNIVCKTIINKKILSLLTDNKNMLYYVMHSFLCPNNSVFVYLSKFFYGCITGSRKIKGTLLNMYPSKHIIFVPNVPNIPINVNNNTENILSNLKYSSECNIGYVGRLSPEKNIILILHAFKRIHDIQNSCILHFYGSFQDDEYEKYVINKVRVLRLGISVKFHGYVSDLHNIYPKIDIIILASVSEGIPFCLLEANKFRVPMVTSRTGCTDELFIKCDIGMQFKLYGIDKWDLLTVKNYDTLLESIGHVKYIDHQSDILVTDYIKHTCNSGKLIYDDLIHNHTYRILSPMDFDIKSNTCNGCIDILIKRKLYMKNIISLCDTFIKLYKKIKFDNYALESIVDYHSNLDETIKLGLSELASNSILDKTDYSNYLDENVNMNIDSSKNEYGVSYTVNLRNLPYNLNIDYKLIGNCYLFVCKNHENFPDFCHELSSISNNEKLQFRIRAPGIYKIGIRFHDDCADGYITIDKFTINMANISIPIARPSYIPKYDIRIVDSNRYMKGHDIKSDVSDILFVFVVCDSFKYKKRTQRVMKYLETFKHKYLILKGTMKKNSLSLGVNEYDDKTKILTVGIYDIYENLPAKIAEGLKWILENRTDITHIYKVDDDFGLIVTNYIPNHFSTYDYYGNFIVDTLITNWHMGKCNDKKLSKTHYNGKLTNHYAGGGYGYILSLKSIKILCNKINIAKIHGELYEDKAIGDILFKNGINVNHQNTDNILYLKPDKIYTICPEQTDITYKIYTHDHCALFVHIKANTLADQKWINDIDRIEMNKLPVESCDIFKKSVSINIKSFDMSKIEIDPTSEFTNIKKTYNQNIKSSPMSHKIDIRCQIMHNYFMKWIDLDIKPDINDIKKTHPLVKRAMISDIEMKKVFNFDIIYF